MAHHQGDDYIDIFLETPKLLSSSLGNFRFIYLFFQYVHIFLFMFEDVYLHIYIYKW